MSDFFDEQVEEDGDFDDYIRQSTSEHTVFLVDAGRRMQDQAGVSGLEGYEETDTYIDLALKVVRELMKQHIISSPKDQMSIVFYDAREADNEGSFPSVNIALKLEESTAGRIRDVEALREDFNDAIGSADSEGPEGVRDGLWAATQILQANQSKASKRVIVFTNQEDPCSTSSDENAIRQIRSRAEALHEAKIEVELFNLTPDGKKFKMDFWGQIVKNPDDELGTQTWTSEPLRLEDLEVNVRRKGYKKRAVASLFWNIGPDYKFAVKLFSLIQKATASKSVPIDLRTNQVLKATGAYIDNDTGAIVEKITKFSFPKDEKQAPRFPKVIITAEERQALKELRPPGINLIGFKPVSCLKNWHQLRPATFVYPDERSQQGSATTFIALHDRLLKRELFALCSIVRNKSAEPRLVAALPQQEEIDEHGTQVTPPGINLIWLPYKDDIRHPELDNSFLGPKFAAGATAEQVKAAEAMLSELEIQDFAPGCIPNPHLQRHFQVVEALALGEEPPEIKKEDDFTIPEPFSDSAKKAILAFRDAVYGQGNRGPLQSVLKRKAEKDAALELDAKVLAKEGKLPKLTVKVLMELCRKEHLSATGRKQELIDRLTQHLGV